MGRTIGEHESALYIYQVAMYQALCKEHNLRPYEMSCFKFVKGCGVGRLMEFPRKHR